MLPSTVNVSLQRLPVQFSVRFFSRSTVNEKHFKLVVAGGGSGGCGIASRFSRKLGAGHVAVIDGAERHYYQPLWTLVGGGLKTLEQSRRNMKDVLPPNAEWIKEWIAKFEPEQNAVVLNDGQRISYDYLIVALGIQCNYNLIPGLEEALSKDPKVCSNFSAKTVERTYAAFKAFEGGNAVFTFPNTPVKCAGAPQKIMYMFEDYLRKNNKRDAAEIHYFTSLGVLFGIKKYADFLNTVCQERNIKIHLRNNLVEVKSATNEAVFENLDTHEKTTIKYNLLHATPPMGPINCTHGSSLVDDTTGFISLNSANLRHTCFPNVFGIGDCTNLPTSKTAAGISSQSKVVYRNLSTVMNGSDDLKAEYDGYTSCPLVTKSNRVVLAEFDYNGQPLETFPLNQARESYLAYLFKAHLFPQLYWHGLLKGFWNGPKFFRKMFRFGMGK